MDKIGLDFNETKEKVKQLLQDTGTASGGYVAKSLIQNYTNKEDFVRKVEQWMKDNIESLHLLDSLIIL